MTKDSLSPAAAAVLDACNDAVERLPLSSPPEQFSIALIAAALRAAAADQLTPYSVAEFDGAAMARNRIITIAAELREATNG